jgi:aspartyl-tRNA(Asn)/glutamyl-tRNA(Gln) amidotransferase subunit B
VGEVIEEVTAASPRLLAQYSGGKMTVKVTFVRQVMKVTKDQASPAIVNKLLDKKLPG